MGIALAARRVVSVDGELAKGTAENPSAASDGVPLIREAEFEIKPVQVDRPTLRLSLTDYANIYPGKGTVDMTIAVEVSGRDTGFPGTPPHWTRLLTACGTRIRPSGDNIFAFKVSGINTNNGPLRHGEAVTGTGMGDNSFVVGDSFSHDGGLLTTIFAREVGTAGTGSGTMVGATSGTSFNVNAKSASKCIAFEPQSNINAAVVQSTTATIDIFTDGKAVRAKGCAGDVEFQFRHGDACVARFTMQGVYNAYLDLAIPTNSYEGHKVPPTFLGTRLSIASPINSPADQDRYGTGGTASFLTEGSLSEVNLRMGNNVVLQPNSLDPDGVQYAIITDREPAGSFNPHEVTSAEFDFIERLVSGKPMRMHILLGATDHTNVASADQNTFEFLTPGVVWAGVADADRDGINIWDASFKLTGGDYDTSATGEAPGQDNELIVVHR